MVRGACISLLGTLQLLQLITARTVGGLQPVQCDPAAPRLEVVAAAIFDETTGWCDLNDDGRITAADLSAAVLRLAATPTPTETPSPIPTDTPSATVTPRESVTPTPTPLPTTASCPAAGAELVVEIDNQTGMSPISILLSGQRTGQECAPGVLAVSYAATLDCFGAGVAVCVKLGSLAPGWWRHSIKVLDPASGQNQHQASLLITSTAPNTISYTAFASVFTVATTAGDGDGSLRAVLQDVGDAPKPALVQFDPQAFPPGVPTSILLGFALPNLATDDVTIDGTDATGASGNRTVDAGGLPIAALAISGARNRVAGMRLRNTGGSNRDVLSIGGSTADGNIIERTIIEIAGTADAIGIDEQAGKDFGHSVNIIRDCQVTGANDKGVKVTTGAYARVEHSWVHDNLNGGIQATLGGHVQAWHNLVEDNRGGSAQNGLSANASTDATPPSFSELRSWGNISRRNGSDGISVRGFSRAQLRDDYLAANGSAGLRVYNDIASPEPPQARVEGSSAVCNGVDGAVVGDDASADLGSEPPGNPGNNAFTQNNLPGGGANLRNATASMVSALNNQWEHCGPEAACNEASIKDRDLSDHGLNTRFVPAQAHRAQQPIVTSAVRTKGRKGELLRIFGSGFNVIDGHFAEDNCSDVTARNRCVPLRGNCVRIGGVQAPVEAVTPTMLVVRWPFTCVEPVALVVTVDHGPTGASSEPFVVCSNDELTP